MSEENSSTQHGAPAGMESIFGMGGSFVVVVIALDGGDRRNSSRGREVAWPADGQAVLDALAARGPGPVRWSLEPNDIEAEGSRLGLPVQERRRVRPDGAVIRWRAVGVPQAWLEPWRCAFMAWEDPVRHPARTPEPHPCGATGFARVAVGVPDRAEA